MQDVMHTQHAKQIDMSGSDISYVPRWPLADGPERTLHWSKIHLLKFRRSEFDRVLNEFLMCYASNSKVVGSNTYNVPYCKSLWMKVPNA